MDFPLSGVTPCTVGRAGEDGGRLTVPPASDWSVGGNSPRSNQRPFPRVGCESEAVPVAGMPGR